MSSEKRHDDLLDTLYDICGVKRPTQPSPITYLPKMRCPYCSAEYMSHTAWDFHVESHRRFE